MTHLKAHISFPALVRKEVDPPVVVMNSNLDRDLATVLFGDLEVQGGKTI